MHEGIQFLHPVGTHVVPHGGLRCAFDIEPIADVLATALGDTRVMTPVELQSHGRPLENDDQRAVILALGYEIR